MAYPGTCHTYTYTPRLFAFEHTHPTASQAPTPNPNIFLWIGGLGDGILTVKYPQAIAASLPPNWALAEVLLSSSYKGWGTGSLVRDAKELGDCVRYFKQLRPGAKIVLMGHSTGCQDIMEYLVGEGKESRDSIDGAILQAGVSDREAWQDMVKADEVMKKQLEELKTKAYMLLQEGKGEEIMPLEGNPVAKEFGAPITAYRLDSLLRLRGDDDYFSSDLDDADLARTFGKIPKESPMMFLWGSEDPYVPAHVDREGILKRWTDVVRQGNGVVDDAHGGVIKGAHHNLNDDPKEVVQDLVERVLGFLKGIEKGFA
jgi:pimeloyl-ACP methyl ester carboxylesterase